MARSGPRKTNRYSEQFKATAVRLSELPEVLIQDVADALDIHPFMLSRWRKQVREGVIVAKGAKLDTCGPLRSSSVYGNWSGATRCSRRSTSS